MRIRWLWVGLGIVAVSARLQGQLPIDTRVLPREVADEVLHVWNAPATLRVAGPYLVEASREVEGDIGVSGGSLTVSGHVTGRIVAINATVRLTSGARVDGEILVVGGTVDGRDLATIGGQIRVYRARLDVARVGDRFELPPDDESGRWWQRNERWRDRGWSSLRLVSAHTYNRVEGLPVIFGPNFGRDLGWGRLSGEASGIWRTSQGFKWNSDVVGHSVKAELQFGVRRGVRLGGRQLDLVEPVESWQLSDEEVGLASVLLHRDFRDYFNRHGGTVYASLFRGAAFDATLGYSDQRWADRRTRDPWTLFRNSETWRENPVLDEGNFHLLNGTLRYDTRNDEGNPWSGWYILGDYEYGTGAISRYGTASPGARTETIDGLTTYDRLFVDVRRYNRIAPGAQLNMRLAAGGWLSGDDLPLQRRFSLGGPGTMPGFDFRRTAGEPDVFQCSTSTLPGSGFPPGRPAQCERFALAQVEYRGDMHFDLFGVLDEERDRRRAGWGRGTEWVVFADAGRGWLVGAPDGGLSYPQGSLPALSTFRADIGLGIVLDNVGVYLAKSLSNGSEPINIFVRLRPRFSRAIRRRLLLLLALAAAPRVAATQPRPQLDVTLPAPGARADEGPMVRVLHVLDERYVTDMLRNGFPARLHFRAELWTTGGFFNARRRSVEWDLLVRYDALRREYEVVRVVRDSAFARERFSQFADAVTEIERPMRAPILPLRERKSQYYNVSLELEMLSVSDLDEVERWLRGELKPAVRGERNPGTAVGRGMRTLLARVLGGEMRRLETRSKTFKP